MQIHGDILAKNFVTFSIRPYVLQWFWQPLVSMMLGHLGAAAV